MDPEERVAEAMKGLLVEYSQQSARLAVQVRGNEYRRAAAAGGGGGFLLSPGERERLRAGSGLELVIVPVMEGDQVVSSSASAEVLVSPLVEGEVRVVPAVERRRWRRQAAAEEWEEIDPETKYRGVRVRFGTRYVAEIHNPTGAGRLWLGTFDTAEQGAWAYDAAARVLRGEAAATNFGDPAQTPSPLSAEMRSMLAFFDRARARRERVVEERGAAAAEAEASEAPAPAPLLLLPAPPPSSDVSPVMVQVAAPPLSDAAPMLAPPSSYASPVMVQVPVPPSFDAAPVPALTSSDASPVSVQAHRHHLMLLRCHI